METHKQNIIFFLFCSLQLTVLHFSFRRVSNFWSILFLPLKIINNKSKKQKANDNFYEL